VVHVQPDTRELARCAVDLGPLGAFGHGLVEALVRSDLELRDVEVFGARLSKPIWRLGQLIQPLCRSPHLVPVLQILDGRLLEPGDVGGVEEDGGTGGESRIDEFQPLRFGSCRGNDVVSTTFQDSRAAAVEYSTESGAILISEAAKGGSKRAKNATMRRRVNARAV